MSVQTRALARKIVLGTLPVVVFVAVDYIRVNIELEVGEKETVSLDECPECPEPPSGLTVK